MISAALHPIYRVAAMAVVYTVAALAVYGNALTSNLTADDWEYLVRIDKVDSIAVCFEILADRYFRPLVVLLYYVCYKLFGVWALPYHIAVVLLHVASGVLLSRVVVSLDGSRRERIGWAAGLLFVVSANHSEAVTWVGGVADVMLACCVLAALLALDAALRAERPLRWMIAGWLFLIAGLFVKESGVVGPGIAGVYGLAQTWRARQDAPGTFAVRLRRTIGFLIVAAFAIAAYFGFRLIAIGNPANAYEGLETSAGMRFAQARAFVLRTFFPPAAQLAHLWASGRDIWLIVAAFLAVIAALFNRRNRLALLACFGCGAIALLPVLPLTISLSTTETERVIYVASAFAAAIIVWVIDALIRPRVAQVAILIVLVAAHSVLLVRNNRRWVEASRAYMSVIDSFAEAVRAHAPARGTPVFVLNLPDNVRGGYVFRRGFYAGLHFRAPELALRESEIVGITSHTQQRATDVIAVRQDGPLDFALDVSPNVFLQLAPPTRPFYTFPEWGRSSYRLRFSNVVGKAAVFYTSGGRVRYLTDIAGDASPFGQIDIPEDNVACAGEAVRFSGWALDDRRVARVEVFDADTNVLMGEATWASGTRPDVAAAYGAYPHTDRAEWNYHLRCAIIRQSGSSALRVRVVAFDEDGHRTDIGVRAVLPDR